MGEQETELLSVPVRLRRAGREIRIVMDGTDPFATAKPDVRLVKLLLTARRFNAVLTRAKTPPHSPSERASVGPTSRLVRLSYIALDITQAILDGRQPRDLTPEKLLEHSRLPLGWHAQRIALGFG